MYVKKHDIHKNERNVRIVCIDENRIDTKC